MTGPPACAGCNRFDNWDVYSNVGTQGRRLDESAPIPETGFTIIQHQLTVYEAGNSVPYTGKLVALAKHQVAAIIDDTTGTATVTNNVALGTGHVKAIVDTMKERNIPPYTADDYVGVGHPTTFRNLKNSLETIHQYTETGLAHIFNGEIGRYESTRYVEQTFIPRGGAANATSYDPWSGTPQAWTNGLSSWAFIMGGDTVTSLAA